MTCRTAEIPARDTSPDPMAQDSSQISSAVTQLLERVRRGDRDAVDRLFPLVYEELRNLARREVRRSSAATMEATGLVHEAYLKMASAGGISADSRAHFVAIAGRAMRQVLVDRARMRGAQKRGGDWVAVTLSDGHRVFDENSTDMIALNEAIERLDSRQRTIVEARLFGGLEESETAALLGVSERTVRREWVKARAWLVRALLPHELELAPPNA